MIHEYLQKLGLGEKEITLYLAILQKGRIGVNLVSQLTGINRTTVYSVAKELSDKGFIILDIGIKPHVLMSVPPEQLRSIVDRQKNIIETLIPELYSVSQDTGFSVPKIKFVPETDIATYLYSETNRWDESLFGGDMTVWGMQDSSFTDKYGEWIDWYYKRPETKKYKVQVVVNSDNNMPSIFPGREVYSVSKEFLFNAAIWVWGDYIIMVSYKEKPYYLIEIYDKRLAQNMRELFRFIWTTSRNLSK